MPGKRFIFFVFSCTMLLLTLITSCQKDDDLKETNTENSALIADSASMSAFASSPGNYLATTGTLQIKIKDSTYTFDATRDSIAFVNVHQGDNIQYFGITAINKEHTLSFGISSSGNVYSNITSAIAGSQLLMSSGNETMQQFSLSKYAGQKNFGNISISQYKQGNILAKGTFFTFLAKGDKITSPFYKVEGTFNLQMK